MIGGHRPRPLRFLCINGQHYPRLIGRRGFPAVWAGVFLFRAADGEKSPPHGKDSFRREKPLVPCVCCRRAAEKDRPLRAARKKSGKAREDMVK